MSKKYRVAIISAGMISNIAHVPAYKNLGDRIDIVAISDLREEIGKETAKRHGIDKVYTDTQKMLEEIKPDIVSVCAPNAYHKELTIMALRYGSHVICEKPIALTYNDAVQMYQEADKAGKYLIACQTSRFDYDAIVAKDLISTGILGEIYFAEIGAVRRRGIPSWGTFHMKEHSAGGPFCDIGVHIVDKFLWLIGNPKLKSLSGMAATKIANKSDEEDSSNKSSGAPSMNFTPRKYNTKEFNVEDIAVGSMRFENGLMVNFKFAWALNMPNSGGINIAGVDGGINLPSLNIYTKLGKHTVDIKPEVNNDRPYENIDFNGHYYLFEHVLRVLDGQEELIIKKEEVINVAACIEAFYLSAKSEKEVTFEELNK